MLKENCKRVSVRKMLPEFETSFGSFCHDRDRESSTGFRSRILAKYKVLLETKK